MKTNNISVTAEQGVCVIVHDVAPAHHAMYESWMESAIGIHRGFHGYLATDVIRPIGAGLRYVVIIRFASAADAEAWLRSGIRAAMLKEARPWLLHEDRYRVHEDNEFWFNNRSKALLPKRWKQWLLSTLAVLPLTAAVPRSTRWLASRFAPGVSDLFVLVFTALVISGIMVYWLMPLLSRWAAGWLGR